MQCTAVFGHGIHCENATMKNLHAYLAQALDLIGEWERRWPAFTRHPAVAVDAAALEAAWACYSERLQDNYPFFHPHYAGQMLKPPHPVAVLGYVAAMLINPSNYSDESGRATVEMESELVKDIAAMFRLPQGALGHLTTSGTIANLEGLWVSRELGRGKAIAFSEQGHFIHERLCSLLDVEGIKVSADDCGRMDVDRLDHALRSGRIGTVVLTAGTPGLGAVDPIDQVLALRERYGFRIHVDASYGGFFALLAWSNDSPINPGPFRAIAECDSIAVDPHKHGLQPLGCGCIVFRDPAVRRLYQHDAPYLSCGSDALSPGGVGLECSRAGAAAGALWLTLQCLPLEPERGLGPIVRACREAAQRWAGLIENSREFSLYVKPELDILTYFPLTDIDSCARLDACCENLQRILGQRRNPIYISLLRVRNEELQKRCRGITADSPSCRILRSVLLKPEHESAVDYLHQSLVEALRACP